MAGKYIIPPGDALQHLRRNAANDGMEFVDVERNLWDPPANPHADDDEFDGADLSAWSTSGTWDNATAIDPYAAFAAGGIRWGLGADARGAAYRVRRSWLMVQADGSSAYRYLHKAITVASNVVAWARLSFDYRRASKPEADSIIGLLLCQTTGGAPDLDNSVIVDLNKIEAGLVRARLLSAVGGQWSANQWSDDVANHGQPFEYVIISRRANAYDAWLLMPGGSRMHLGSVTAAITPDRVAFRFYNSSTTTPGNMCAGLDFVRFVESATWLP